MSNANRKFKREYEGLLKETLKQGRSVARFCADIEVCKQTFYHWLENYPSFREAYRIGLTASEALWLERGEDNLANRDFNHQIYNMQLANRFGITKNRSIRVKPIFEKNAAGKQKTVMEQFEAAASSFADGSMTLEEFNLLADGFSKLATIKERDEMEERVRQLEGMIGNGASG